MRTRRPRGRRAFGITSVSRRCRAPRVERTAAPKRPEAIEPMMTPIRTRFCAPWVSRSRPLPLREWHGRRISAPPARGSSLPGRRPRCCARRKAHRDEKDQAASRGHQSRDGQAGGVEERDDDDRREVVHDREREEKRLQQGRDLVAEQAEDAEREGNVGRGGDRPAACLGRPDAGNAEWRASCNASRSRRASSIQWKSRKTIAPVCETDTLTVQSLDGA
ncbi:hypothetical protein C8D95_104265 [Silicimonas algicola]|uniref:Uncharacterized protein n=1 Tax=Silicimonas algicola TaxID=1826607 RepID=A0A316G7I8_9RHOB|nr:hypothetical protein C8D95_104265 [Silicimonas algicola]